MSDADGSGRLIAVTLDDASIGSSTTSPLQVLDADRLDDDPGAAPGEVVAVDGDRLVVAAGGGAIAVRLVRADGDKLEAGEYARNAGLTAGVRLGV